MTLGGMTIVALPASSPSIAIRTKNAARRCIATGRRQAPSCPIKADCTTGDYRRITRWEHEHILDVVQERLDGAPEAARLRRQTVEHVFGTLKGWMGSTHFLTKTLPKVAAEMSLQVLAYNLKRAIKILGARELMNAMRA